jgi:hypothetical protein
MGTVAAEGDSDGERERGTEGTEGAEGIDPTDTEETLSGRGFMEGEPTEACRSSERMGGDTYS